MPFMINEQPDNRLQQILGPLVQAGQQQIKTQATQNVIRKMLTGGASDEDVFNTLAQYDPEYAATWYKGVSAKKEKEHNSAIATMLAGQAGIPPEIARNFKTPGEAISFIQLAESQKKQAAQQEALQNIRQGGIQQPMITEGTLPSEGGVTPIESIKMANQYNQNPPIEPFTQGQEAEAYQTAFGSYPPSQGNLSIQVKPVQDPNSPTGWSYFNLQTREMIPGAPPPNMGTGRTTNLGEALNEAEESEEIRLGRPLTPEERINVRKAARQKYWDDQKSIVPYGTEGENIVGRQGSRTGVYAGKIPEGPIPSKLTAEETTWYTQTASIYDQTQDAIKTLLKNPDFAGPFQGWGRKFAAKWRDDPEFQRFAVQIASGIRQLYIDSGKQVSFNEMEVFRNNILPGLTQPDENLLATLLEAKAWMERNLGAKFDAWKAQNKIGLPPNPAQIEKPKTGKKTAEDMFRELQGR